MKNEITLGAEFLDEKYTDLKKSEQIDLNYETSEVEDTEIDELIKSMLKKDGYLDLSEKYEINQEKMNGNIDTWLNNAQEFHKRHRDEESMDIIREAFYNEYVIKEENFSESYFEYQKKLAREQGHGDIEITDEFRKQGMDIVIKDQESTLDTWVEYLLSSDSDVYPMWVKYWALRSMTKLSSYDKEAKSFGNRRKDTTAPFPDLNREALAYVVDLITKKANNEKIEVADDNPELQKLLESENFGQFYAYAIEKVTPTEKNELEVIEGEWVKYDQGSDHMPLVESLQGYATGWCTAGESTAETQLRNGGFYVYYSKDKDGNNTIPRVAIRMQGSQIGEVRGIGPNQNMDPYIGEVAQAKIQEFSDHEKYEKKTADMKCLTEIEKKQNEGEELTKEDLRFLYEIDSKIEGFGYQKDPRIEKIRGSRDVRKDISDITGFLPEEISLTNEEVLKGNIKYHYGNLYLSVLASAEGLEFPKNIGGGLYLGSLASAEGLELPESIGGDIELSRLISVEGLKLPGNIRGNLYFNSLTSAKDLKFPESIGGFLNLKNLKSAVNLELPESIGGNLDLSNLTLAENIEFPESIGGDLYLSSLTSVEGLKLPGNIRGNLNLNKLTSFKDLKFPENIGGSLGLDGLISVESLKLPQTIGGDLNLRKLQSVKGLEFPQNIRGNLNLNSLGSAEGLEIPQNIGGLAFGNLTSAEGLNIPESIRDLDLSGLTSAEGLNIPENIRNLDLSGLTSAEGLNLPQNIGGDLNLKRLQSVKGLEFPQNIEGYLFLNSITSVEVNDLIEKVKVGNGIVFKDKTVVK